MVEAVEGIQDGEDTARSLEADEGKTEGQDVDLEETDQGKGLYDNTNSVS